MTLRNRTAIVLLVVTALAVGSSSAWAQSADLSKIVGIGDSLMSGEASTSVVETFQVHAVPALVYRQVHGAEGFEQALVSEPGLPPRLILGPEFLPIPIPGPDGVPLNADLPRAYDNMGMSGGIRVQDLTTIDGLETCNAINQGPVERLGCDRVNLVLRDRGTAVEQVLQLDPTLVLLWVGGNDVLRAALGGIVIEGVTMTPVAVFETFYRITVDDLTGGGAAIAVANIPNVADVPFVNTVPPVLVNPETGEPVIVDGQLVPLIGPDGPLSLADKVTLFAIEELGAGCGIPPGFPGSNGCPLSDGVVLDVDEQQQIQTRVDEFNEIIATVAGEYGAALYDFASAFSEITANGLNLGGIEYTTDFISGGLVSFDAFHPNTLIAAVNANGFIRAINRTYGTSIPIVDLSPYVFGSAGSMGPPPSTPAMSTAALERIRGSLVLPEVGEVEPPSHRPESRQLRTRSIDPAADPDDGRPSRRRGASRRLR